MLYQAYFVRGRSYVWFPLFYWTTSNILIMNAIRGYYFERTKSNYWRSAMTGFLFAVIFSMAEPSTGLTIHVSQRCTGSMQCSGVFRRPITFWTRTSVMELAWSVNISIDFSSRMSARKDGYDDGSGNPRLMSQIAWNIPIAADSAGIGSAVEDMWWVLCRSSPGRLHGLCFFKCCWPRWIAETAAEPTAGIVVERLLGGRYYRERLGPPSFQIWDRAQHMM